ncbi:MAG: nucleotidyl transferase AbiEii/AbiGii toxin family protein [Elusimicrobia bacterium]|nr:nucleotidyl transferase AbiEii/AbiGii toxin family protein [Elusimicrobiota bacterium]
MPEFFHERKDAKTLIETIAADTGLSRTLIEKDYWIMHCLWGLQQLDLSFEMKGGTSLSKGWAVIERFSEDIDIRFDPPPVLNLKGDKPAHIKARLDFYDGLAKKMKIPGVTVIRNTDYDDAKAQNGGISLRYKPLFAALPGLKPEVLLEAGFDKTAPNEPCDFSSWALDRVLKAGLDVTDNRAQAVKCFNPEYTFVDKLQTICRRFRQHRDRHDPEKDRPRLFMRHYYDLYMLLGVERVAKFIGSAEYEAYKKQKIKGTDAAEFETREAFMISQAETRALFAKEFELSMGTLLFSPGLKFAPVIEKIQSCSSKF